MNSTRAKIIVRGAVQGVGFRPFVYCLARDLGLSGGVRNTGQGVEIEIEGSRTDLDEFLNRLQIDKPLRSSIESVDCSFLESTGQTGFAIQPSDPAGSKTTLVMPDLATCEDCVSEIFQPSNRRFFYPFTNCAHCGPRFSIIERLPYDRAHTSMKKFQMCRKCAEEYRNPQDRRFHAEPNACSECGPHLTLCSPEGQPLALKQQALVQAVEALRDGQIIALKNLGGFQLLTDARNQEAVQRLRFRKRRMEKPFALLYPSLESIHLDCVVSDKEEALLRSPQAPIVLLKRRVIAEGQTSISPAVAPRNPWLGVMLPSTPLHWLLSRQFQRPLVATSGNISDEPICIDEEEAFERFRGVADLLLIHDRPILRHVDDSVVRVILGGEQVLRRARGYAPLPIYVTHPLSNVLAVGAHLKNSVALSLGNAVFVSQHIGDLENELAYAAFCQATADLPDLYEVEPELLVCDLHPDYLSTQYAGNLPVARHAVQHHWAHVASCMAENQIEAPVLGVAWDGTGLGPDGTIWGGEFLLTGPAGYERVAHLRAFRLPGGNAAIRQPRRAAIGLLLEFMSFEDLKQLRLPLLDGFSESELRLIHQMRAQRINAPVTSSAGRFFDAMAALIGLRQRTTFEGQAAMELEFSAKPGMSDVYPFQLLKNNPMVLDWEPMVLEILRELQDSTSIGVISAKLHHTLVEMIVAVAHKIGQPRIALTGGCFQSRLLTERTVLRLREEGFVPFWHRQVPPNDGGIALGQVMAATWDRRPEQLPVLSRARATETATIEGYPRTSHGPSKAKILTETPS
ncbi:MAG: (NiFe) hydrogenase maturation protein HypF [Verrucomicrobiales bacterium]|nr:(NiFe) hydrogenase maturation protein HypF [Verrucomicrobiales bacterium]